ncbi:hypothetical protein DPMN_035407 [Dreissena polymorpha]|uniref:Uncharacterized protein n=1 Tax=Dreissena polymorpha TaxID=45954 RepID=A0A9D4RMV6_DREPO|nr:hypothetical protein DPMN_035407 [Dreissena polymorpha]
MMHCKLSYLTVPRPIPQHLTPPWAQHYTPCHLHPSLLTVRKALSAVLPDCSSSSPAALASTLGSPESHLPPALSLLTVCEALSAVLPDCFSSSPGALASTLGST